MERVYRYEALGRYSEPAIRIDKHEQAHRRNCALFDPFGNFNEWDRQDAARDEDGRPTGMTADPLETLSETEKARDAMFARMKDAYRLPRNARRARPGADDSMPGNYERAQRVGASGDYTRGVGSAPRIPADETLVPMRPAFAGGNQGNAAGGYGGGADGDEGDDDGETQKAQDAMTARMKDRWRTPRRTRGITGWITR